MRPDDIKIESWEKLKPTKDRKVNPRGYEGGFITRQNGSKRSRGMVGKIYNSFGLPAGHSCPGRTAFCRDCYAAKNSEVCYPNVGRAMWHNWNALEAFYVRYGIDGYVALLNQMVNKFEKQIDYYGLEDHERVFRIHWDGDFFSMDYAKAWAIVIDAHSQIQFWCYTRTFREELDVTPVFEGRCPNLELYLSVDEDNIFDAQRCLVESNRNGGRLHVAACSVNYTKAHAIQQLVRGGSVMPPDGLPPGTTIAARKPIACPENAGNIPLISDEGVGACISCGVCIRGSRDILFASSHEKGQDGLFTPGEVTTNVRLPLPRKPRQLQEGSGNQEEGSQAQGQQGGPADAEAQALF